MANPVYADAPWLVMRAIAGVGDTASQLSVGGRPRDLVARPLIKISRSMIEQRERCRDAVMRLTHQLRLALREWGSRLADRGLLAERDDVFYLLSEELYSSNLDLAGTVSRRRAERDRLAQIDLPLRFTQPMDLSGPSFCAEADRAISGVPAAAGIAVGRVRVLCSPDDELRCGEVLVARVTDTGWTPFFATAAAVVTDIGASMSHASIVAREFGIPAVVGTKNGSQILKDGQLVEVNGATGRVTLLG